MKYPRHRSRWFKLPELVDPIIHQDLGERAWELLEPDALRMLDGLREKFGRLVVNDWYAGGRFSESGLRRCDTTTGAKWSQHKYGRAFDVKPKDATPQEMFVYVLDHQHEFPLLACVENVGKTITWLHVDTRNHSEQSIRVIEP